MSTTILIILGVLVLVIAIVVVNLFTMTLNEFLEKTIRKFLWLWLPFHAFKKLTKEMREKYLK